MFRLTIPAETMPVLPLHLEGRPFELGYTSLAEALDGAPSVEVLCGGINGKAPDAAAVWREGNLVHVGFALAAPDLSPAGRALLVDAIAYAARFSQDRPVLEVGSPFDDELTRSRDALRAWLANPVLDVKLFDSGLDPALLGTLRGKDRAAKLVWFDEHRDWLRMNESRKLVVDEELRALGVPALRPAFLDAAVEALAGADPARASAARKALARYVPDGPGPDASPASWRAWVDAHRPYLVWSEWGGYRWYVDPLAERRGVPSADLRGPARADLPGR